MVELTLVYGFRNREIGRVEKSIHSLSTQSFQNFEVIFVDYGSDVETSSALRFMLNKYSFVKYVYSDTYGMPWNRSHALNTGIRLAKSPFVMTMDVDLILSENYLQQFISKANLNKVIYSNFYLLPEGYDFKIDVRSQPNFKIHMGSAGIAIYPLEKLLEIGGYDEFYKIWGCEDRDLKHRIVEYGMESEVMKLEDAPVFHQWHPLTNFKRNFLPGGWWEEMNYHYFQNKSQLKRNNNEWGKLLTGTDRPSLNYLKKDDIQTINALEYSNIISLFDDLVKQFMGIKTNEALKLVFLDKKKQENLGILPDSKFIRLINRMMLLISKRYKIVDFLIFESRLQRADLINLYDISHDELRNFCWTFSFKFKDEIKDFFSGIHKGEFIFIIVKE